MKRYLFNYQTIVNFSAPVINHSILLRPLPLVGGYLDVETEHLVIPLSFHVRKGMDQLGNRIVYGIQRDAHISLVYVSTGIVSMDEYAVNADAVPLLAYKQATPLTFLTEDHAQTLSGDVTEDALELCHKVYKTMIYTPSVTSVDTPAMEVIKTRQGVCQDYAHLMIALCRVNGIVARYVCGFMEGEGATHAWVEVYDGYRWIGFDPTHDRRITYGYVKLAHGRDASDCPVSRGIYAGNAIEQTQLHVMLKEI